MSKLQVRPADEADIKRLMQIVIASFHDMPIEQLMENTTQHATAMEQRHLRAWAEHRAARYVHPMGYKCVLPEPSTGGETIVASAEWVIYDQPRSEAEYVRPHFLFSGEWIADAEARARAQAALRPFVEARVRWNGGRAHAILMWMATDPAFRRRGAATACVRYGVERCRELGIPAYLEASETGRPVYEAAGFEVVEEIPSRSNGIDLSFPAMMWWPPGYSEDDKKPAIPGYKLNDV